MSKVYGIRVISDTAGRPEQIAHCERTRRGSAKCALLELAGITDDFTKRFALVQHGNSE